MTGTVKGSASAPIYLRWSLETSAKRGELWSAPGSPLTSCLASTSETTFAKSEERFYTSTGFTENEGHPVYTIDQRPYALRNQARRDEAL